MWLTFNLVGCTAGRLSLLRFLKSLVVVNPAHCFLQHKVVQKTVFCNDMVKLNDLLNAKIKSRQIALYSKPPNFKPAKIKAFTVLENKRVRYLEYEMGILMI